MLRKKVRVLKYEVGLVFRHGDFVKLLYPGEYRVWSSIFSEANTIEIVDMLDYQFEHCKLDMLVEHEDFREAFDVVQLEDHQRALIWRDGRLQNVLGPGVFAFSKQPRAVKVEVFDINDFEFKHQRLDVVMALPEAHVFIERLHVEPHEKAVLYRDGEYVRTLNPGVYCFWKQSGRIHWDRVDLREQVADVVAQEIMTADKVTLRVNLVLAYRVEDVLKSVSVVRNVEQTLYREAQLALRAAIGTRQLEQLLADKEAVGSSLKNEIRERASEYGLVVQSVGLRDIILPGEMKDILNQVIEAQKRAEANLIQRREETAAARSQVNTARLLNDNPQLVRMKELEALQEILKGAKATFVFGQGNLTTQVQSLLNSDSSDAQ